MPWPRAESSGKQTKQQRNAQKPKRQPCSASNWQCLVSGDGRGQSKQHRQQSPTALIPPKVDLQQQQHHQGFLKSFCNYRNSAKETETFFSRDPDIQQCLWAVDVALLTCIFTCQRSDWRFNRLPGDQKKQSQEPEWPLPCSMLCFLVVKQGPHQIAKVEH